jgi:hypothetical protein
VLRGQAPFHWRERERDAGLGPGAASRPAHRSPEVRLSRLRLDRPDASSRTPDRGRHGDADAACAGMLIAKYIRRSIVSRESSSGTRSIRAARRWPAGSAAPAGGWKTCTSGCAGMSSPPTISSPMTRRFRCSIRAVGARKRGGSGSRRSSSGHQADPSLRRRSFCSRPAARPNVRPRISNASRACCMSAAMPTSSGWPPLAMPCSPPAGRAHGASSTKS